MPKPQSPPLSEVTDASHSMSPGHTSKVFVKLSSVTRVCCADEVPTWFYLENFNAPTGTWHFNSRRCSRTSSLPFAHHPPGGPPKRTGRHPAASRKVGDMTAKLPIPKDEMGTEKGLGLRSEPAFLTHNLNVAIQAHEPTCRRPSESILRGSGVCRQCPCVRCERAAIHRGYRHR